MIGLRRENFRISIRKQQLTKCFNKKRLKAIQSFDCIKLQEDADMLAQSFQLDDPYVNLTKTIDYIENSQTTNNLIIGLEALNRIFYHYDTKDLECVEILLKSYPIASQQALKCINNLLVDNIHLADQFTDLIVDYDPELKDEITQFIWIISEAVDNLQLLDYLEILEKSMMEDLYGPRQQELTALNTVLQQLGENKALEEFIDKKEELIKTILKYQIQVVDGYLIEETNYIDCLRTIVQYTDHKQINQLYFYGFDSLVTSMFQKINENRETLLNFLDLFTNKQSILLNSFIILSKEQDIFELLMTDYNKQTLNIICNSIEHDKVLCFGMIYKSSKRKQFWRQYITLFRMRDQIRMSSDTSVIPYLILVSIIQDLRKMMNQMT
ncbi:hypothetical protein pb186bvf_017061 [Paramecium bursaria]